MPQQGAVPWSFKSDTSWRGMTTTSKALPFHFDLLENCYVSSDGQEIRSFPGWICMVDPVTDARLATDTTPNLTSAPLGYETLHLDVRRPVTAAVGASTYLQQIAAGSVTDVQFIWNRPTTIHGVEQVHGRWVFFGESGDRFEPIYNNARTAFTYITGVDDNAGTSIDLTLNTAPSTTATVFNSIAVTTPGQRIYVEGVTGPLATALNYKSHEVTAIVGAVVTVSTAPGGAVAATTGLTAFAARVSGNSQTADSTDISDDEESLTIWTATSRGSVLTSEIERVYPAHVANRQPDIGDATGNIRPGNTNTTGNTKSRSRRRQRSLPYRLVPHVAGNRLILAAPGYGCVFQAPAMTPVDFAETSETAGIQWVGNDVYDKPRCVGVPKAVQYEDPDKTTATPSLHIQDLGAASATIKANQSFGGSDASVTARVGTYKFKFAYKDDLTGEIGLASEPVSITTDTSDTFQGIVLYPYFPGYLMHESLALSINVYRTQKDGDTYYFDRTIPALAYINGVTPTVEHSKYGLQPAAVLDSYYHHVRYEAIYQSDADLALSDAYVPEALEQMPMGCKAAKTIRGWTLYGGALGNAGPQKELQLGTGTLEYDRTSGVNAVHYNRDELTMRWGAAGAAPAFRGAEDRFGCGAHSIPPSYAGQQVFSRYLFPSPRHTVRINKLINTITSDLASRAADVRFSLVDTPLRSEAYVADASMRTQDVYLMLSRGKLQISEADNPGVVPATNTTVIANERDEDVEGIGDAGGSAVVCTRSKTYFLGFSSSPVGVPAEVASDQFGCIAPNSMVEFGGGCAWISDRGPVAFIGGMVQHIGEPLERLFYGEGSRYLRDRAGMMRHSWACHDAERGLLYFGVFANRAVGTSNALTVSYRGTSYNWVATENLSTADEIRSRFACDEVLVYSYKVGAWSVWRPPVGIGVQWMTRGLDAEGNNRVWWLGSDKRLYCLDDAYGQFDKESNYKAVLETGSTTVIGTATTIATTNRIRIGCTVAFYTGGGGSELVMIGTRTVASTTASTFTLDSAIVLPTGGCKMVVGARVATIRTTFHNWKRDERAQTGKLGIRYSLWSRYANGGVDGDRQASFMSVSAKTSVKVDGIPTIKTGVLTTDGSVTYRPLAETPTSEHVFEATAALGNVGGMNHQIEVQLVGGAQVRVSDIYAEVG